MPSLRAYMSISCEQSEAEGTYGGGNRPPVFLSASFTSLIFLLSLHLCLFPPASDIMPAFTTHPAHAGGQGKGEKRRAAQ